MLKLFIDDMRPMPTEFNVLARTFDQAVMALASMEVSTISFDHDLGDTVTGYDIACLIEKGARERILMPMKWSIHSANPVGRKNIKAAMESAEKLWTQWREEQSEKHAREHKHLWTFVKKLPTDFEPYGVRVRESSDCSCGCRYFMTLEGELGMDWGICSNPKSPRAGLLTFEHMGCPEFDVEPDDEERDRLDAIIYSAGKAGSILEWAKDIRGRRGPADISPEEKKEE